MFKVYFENEIEIRGRSDINRKLIGETQTLDEAAVLVKAKDEGSGGEAVAVNNWTGEEFYYYEIGPDGGAWEKK